MPSSNSSSVTMEDEDKGTERGGGRVAAQSGSGKQPVLEKKKTWSELKQVSGRTFRFRFYRWELEVKRTRRNFLV